MLLLLVPFICAPQTDSEYARGVAAFRAGDYASAADLFAKAELAAPGTSDALIYQAKSLIHLQNFSFRKARFAAISQCTRTRMKLCISSVCAAQGK